MDDKKPLKERISDALHDKSKDKGKTAPTTDDPPEVDLGPCASVPRGKWVTALEVRHRGDKPWEAFQYRDIGYHSTFTPTLFEVWFEGRDHRSKLVVKGRNLHGYYTMIVQHRLEWIEPALDGRDFVENGIPVITSVEVVTEKVKG